MVRVNDDTPTSVVTNDVLIHWRGVVRTGKRRAAVDDVQCIAKSDVSLDPIVTKNS